MANAAPRRAMPADDQPTPATGGATAVTPGGGAPSGARSSGGGGAPRWLVVALIGLLLLGMLYALVHALKHSDATPAPSPSASGATSGAASPSASSSGDCSAASALIDADATWAKPLTAAAQTWGQKTSDGCPAVRIAATDDAAISKSGLGAAKGWAPADPSVAQGSAQLSQSAPVVVGSTPLVLVAQKQVHEALGTRQLDGATLAALASGQKSWNDYGRNWGPLRLVLPNPATTVAGAVGFQTIASTVAGGGTPTGDLSTLQKHLVDMAQVQYHVAQTVPAPEQVLQHLAPVATDDTGRGAAGPRVGVTTEAALLGAGDAANGLWATPLAGGLSGVQMSLVNPTADPQVQAFTTWLRSPEGQKALAAQGITTTGQAPSASARAALGLPATMPMSVTANSAASVGQARQMYTGFSQRMATTTVLDASGSMAERLPGSPLRKIDLVTQASASTWQQWPDGSASALFTFNASDAGVPSIRLVVPQIVAGAPGSAQKMQAYGAHLADIPVSGGTPLYDAINAGYTYAQQHYLPGHINQVLVVTDGADQDAKEQLTYNALVTKLNAKDPKRPIALRFVALGPAADFGTLSRLAQATGGRAEWATAPQNLAGVLQDIMS